ncbi:MAG: hypothetical protein JXB35_04530 [Anaerolineae bacterium]|nr:hypothetical protein [Anaerolineae bacterium]
MINSMTITGNILWVSGIALLLANWSWAYYEAQRLRAPFRTLRKQSPYPRVTLFGELLFASGLALSDARLWAKPLWGAIAIILMVFAIRDLRTRPAREETE